jgi:RNA recognition motif-containing protein
MVELFVGNLDEDVTKEDLMELFKPFGKVESAQIWIDFGTGKSRGFGYGSKTIGTEHKQLKR